jgi:hypothetical protein
MGINPCPQNKGQQMGINPCPLNSLTVIKQGQQLGINPGPPKKKDNKWALTHVHIQKKDNKWALTHVHTQKRTANGH